MPAQEQKSIGHSPFETAKGHTTEPHAAAVDNPMLRWLFSSGLTGIAEGVPFLHGLLKKSDGMTSQQRGAGVGWDGGFKVAAESSRKIEGDQNHAMDMAVRMGYAGGNVTIEHATGGKLLGDDGAKLTDARSTQLAAGKDGAHLKGRAESARKLGDDSSKQATDYSAGYGPGGPTGSLLHNTETHDGYTTHKQGAGAKYGEKGWEISANASRNTKIDDDHQMGSATSANFKDGRATFEHTKESRLKDEDLTGVVNENKSTLQGGIGKGGVSVEHAKTDTTEVNGEKFTDQTKRGYKDGKLTQSKTHTRTYKDDDGNEHTDSHGTNVAVSTSGANVGYSNEKKTKDGGSSANAVNAGYNADKGEFNANASHTTTTTSGTKMTAGAGATVDEHGNLTGANVNAGVTTKKGTSVSASGKYSVEAGKPQERDGVWVVDWSRSVSGGAKAGKEGGRGSVGVSGEASHQDLGTRVFHSQKEAEYFAAHAALLIPTDQPSPTTVSGALALEIGESRGDSDARKGGLSVSGSAGVAGAGVGAEKGSSHGTMIERVSPNLFQVTLSSADSHGMSGQFGIGGATAGGYSQGGESQSLTVQFDLSTDLGRKSYEEFNSTHQTPAKGGRVISQTQAEQQRHGTVLNYGPAGSASFNSSTWDSTTTDATGKTDVHGGGYDQSIVSNIPFLKGHDNMGISLVGIEKNDRQRSYVLQGTVDASDGEASREDLYKLTGMNYDQTNDAAHGGVKSSGKWRVDIGFTNAMADQFMNEIGSERHRDQGIFEGADQRNDLRRELQEAKSSDDRMKAIARYVGEAGFLGKSLRLMRDKVGDKEGQFDYDLMLPNDKNFRGVQGRLELEHKLAGYQKLMTNEASSAPLVSSLQGELSELRRQRAEIADPKRYTDLPDELRAQQVAKLDHYIETAYGLRQSAALAATKLHPDQKVDPNEGQQLDHDVASVKKGRPADHQAAELRRLRHQLSLSDFQIHDAQGSFDAYQEMAKHAARTSDGVRAVREHPQEWAAASASGRSGQALQKIAAAQMRATEELRVQFILAMNKPEEALAIGNLLLAQLKMSESLMASAAEGVHKEYSVLSD